LFLKAQHEAFLLSNPEDRKMKNENPQDSAMQAAMTDAAALIETLELPYLIELQQRLAAHIGKRKEVDRVNATLEIRRIAASVGLSLDELMRPVTGHAKSPKAPKPVKPVKHAEIRYRDPETGKGWSGRGLEPKWLKGRDREQFRVPN
jgi:DNA-binding protein H-NS